MWNYFKFHRYLAGGSLQRHIASCYRVSKQHFGMILDDVCNAICTALADQFNASRTEQDWLDIANNFNYRWNLPNCVGSNLNLRLRPDNADMRMKQRYCATI